MTPPIPSTLDEAVDQIVNAMPPDVRDGWASSKNGYQARLHHGYGTGLRNSLGLWFNETPLAKWFLSKGLWMGDDRSGVILDAVHRRLKGLPTDDTWLAGEVSRYNAHWRRHGIDETGQRIAGHVEPSSWTLTVDKHGGIVDERPGSPADQNPL